MALCRVLRCVVPVSASTDRARAKRRREAGLCYVCGQAPAWQPEKACEPCREKSKARDRARHGRAKRPPNELELNDQFRAEKADRAAKWESKREPRPCGRCGRPFRPTMARRVTCLTCWKNDAAVRDSVRARWAS